MPQTFEFPNIEFDPLSAPIWARQFILQHLPALTKQLEVSLISNQETGHISTSEEEALAHLKALKEEGWTTDQLSCRLIIRVVLA